MGVLRERHREVEDGDDGGRQGASWLPEELASRVAGIQWVFTQDQHPWVWFIQRANIRRRTHDIAYHYVAGYNLRAASLSTSHRIRWSETGTRTRGG